MSALWRRRKPRAARPVRRKKLSCRWEGELGAWTGMAIDHVPPTREYYEVRGCQTRSSVVQPGVGRVRKSPTGGQTFGSCPGGRKLTPGRWRGAGIRPLKRRWRRARIPAHCTGFASSRTPLPLVPANRAPLPLAPANRALLKSASVVPKNGAALPVAPGAPSIVVAPAAPLTSYRATFATNSAPLTLALALASVPPHRAACPPLFFVPTTRCRS